MLPGLLLSALLAAAGVWIFRFPLTRATHLESGSSYRSAADGSRALYLLLIRLGYGVQRLQRAPYLDDERVQLVSVSRPEPPGSPRRSQAEAAAEAELLSRGGRLLLFSKVVPQALLEALSGKRAASPRKGTGRARKTSAELPPEQRENEEEDSPAAALRFRDPAGREVLLHHVVGREELPAGAVPLLVSGSRRAGYRLSHGRGELLVVGSSDPATNAGLPEGENLEFVLSLLDKSRPVLFNEYAHGFDEDETLPGLLARYGLRALPFQLGLLLLLLARRASAAAADPAEAADATGQGAREDLVAAVARLARRFVPERQAAEAFVESFRVRLTDPRLSPSRVSAATRELEELSRRGEGLVETHREILRIEREVWK